jgi:hypothetical protein
MMHGTHYGYLHKGDFPSYPRLNEGIERERKIGRRRRQRRSHALYRLALAAAAELLGLRLTAAVADGNGQPESQEEV